MSVICCWRFNEAGARCVLCWWATVTTKRERDGTSLSRAVCLLILSESDSINAILTSWSIRRKQWAAQQRILIRRLQSVTQFTEGSIKPGFHSNAIAWKCVKISRNKRKHQPIIGMLGRSSGNHDWLLANASACVSCGFRLRNARNASDCVRTETRLNTLANEWHCTGCYELN